MENRKVQMTQTRKTVIMVRPAKCAASPFVVTKTVSACEGDIVELNQMMVAVVHTHQPWFSDDWQTPTADAAARTQLHPNHGLTPFITASHTSHSGRDRSIDRSLGSAGGCFHHPSFD